MEGQRGATRAGSRCDSLARRLKKSRSQLYAEAVAEYVRRWDPDEVRRAIDAAVERVPQETAPFATRTARRTLRRVAW